MNRPIRGVRQGAAASYTYLQPGEGNTTAAQNGAHALRDLLTCPVCLERLDRDSRCFPCQHTACLGCLHGIVASTGMLTCPECRLRVNTPVDQLPRNLYLVRLLDCLRFVAQDLESSRYAMPDPSRRLHPHADRRWRREPEVANDCTSAREPRHMYDASHDEQVQDALNLRRALGLGTPAERGLHRADLRLAEVEDTIEQFRCSGVTLERQPQIEPWQQTFDWIARWFDQFRQQEEELHLEMMAMEQQRAMGRESPWSMEHLDQSVQWNRRGSRDHPQTTMMQMSPPSASSGVLHGGQWWDAWGHEQQHSSGSGLAQQLDGVATTASDWNTGLGACCTDGCILCGSSRWN